MRSFDSQFCLGLVGINFRLPFLVLVLIVLLFLGITFWHFIELVVVVRLFPGITIWQFGVIWLLDGDDANGIHNHSLNLVILRNYDNFFDESLHQSFHIFLWVLIVF